MNSIVLVSTALKSLNHHKGRSLLTMLGIIIGIASIISILAIGNGAAEKAKRQILAQGRNYIYIHAGNWLAEGKVKSKREKTIKHFVLDDLAALQGLIPSVKKTSPYFQSQNRISHQSAVIMSNIKGGNENLLMIMDRKLKQGTYFNQYHIQKGSRVIVLGAKAAKDLFKLANPIGKTVQILNVSFTVIGVLTTVDGGQDFQDPNIDVFVPHTALRRYIQRSISPQFGAMVISGRSTDEMPTTVRHIKKVLRARRHLDPGEPDDFFVYDQGSMMKAAQAASGVLNLLLMIIAAISLLVGGIGVMNIMLVSVTERTKEIGIRMALGAPDKLILQQFLIEALIICCIGGLMGILIGLLIPHGAKYFTGWEVTITSSSVIASCAAIVAVGVIFGYYPARKASQLSPVEALSER